MSSDPNPTASSEGSQPPAPPKKRNPIERIIVWGLIVVMVGVCAREAVARFGYTNSLNSLQTALQADEVGPPLTLEQVPAHLSGSPRQETDEAKRIVSYHWSGLLKDYGSIHIQYSGDNEVLSLLTADAPPPPEPTVHTEEELAEDSDPLAEMGAGGGPADGSGGGRRGFDFTQADTDGDGKLSLEEAPERMQERFAEIDANSDGFVDQEELAARRAARNREEGGGDRPQRPARPAETTEDAGSDTEAPADTENPEGGEADDNSDTPAEESPTPNEQTEQPTSES